MQDVPPQAMVDLDIQYELSRLINEPGLSILKQKPRYRLRQLELATFKVASFHPLQTDDFGLKKMDSCPRRYGGCHQ